MKGIRREFTINEFQLTKLSAELGPQVWLVGRQIRWKMERVILRGLFPVAVKSFKSKSGYLGEFARSGIAGGFSSQSTRLTLFRDRRYRAKHPSIAAGKIRGQSSCDKSRQF